MALVSDVPGTATMPCRERDEHGCGLRGGWFYLYIRRLWSDALASRCDSHPLPSGLRIHCHKILKGQTKSDEAIGVSFLSGGGKGRVGGRMGDTVE